MNLFARYLAVNVYGAVLFVLIGFLALFAFFDLIGQLDDIGRGGYQLQHALVYVVLGLPRLAYELLPVASLIGAIYGFAQLAARSEVTAARAAGWSTHQALGAVSIVALPLMILTAGIGEYLAPPAERYAMQVRTGAMGTNLSGEFKSGLWVRDLVGSKSDGASQTIWFVNARAVLPDETLKDIRVFEFDREMRLVRIARAQSAQFVKGEGWRLVSIELTRIERSVDSQGLERLSTSISQVPELKWETVLKPEVLGTLSIPPERMSLRALSEAIQHLSDNRQVTNRHLMAAWKKGFYPIATWVMLVLALPFAFVHVRSGGVGFKVFVGVMLGIGFHLSNALASHLGLINHWPPSAVAAVPSLMVLLGALMALRRMERY